MIDYSIPTDRTLEEIQDAIEKEREISEKLADWPEIDSEMNDSLRTDKK